MRPSTALLDCLGTADEHGLEIDAIEQSTDLGRHAIHDAVRVLVARGLAERLRPGVYRLTSAGHLARANGDEIRPGPCGVHVNAPRSGTLRRRLWCAMRAMSKFSIDDLLLRAASGDEADARTNVRKYLSALERAGYLARMKHRQPGDAPTSNGFARWLLLRNTGPIAPIWQSSKGRLHDPNTGETIDLTALEEASHA